jgi:hypothetical protein
MKRLSSSEIKKIVIGITLSDAYIDGKGRLDFYSRYEGYAKHIYDVLSQVSGVKATFKVKHDKRGYTGYRVWTRQHEYLKKIHKYCYHGRKELNRYNISRIDSVSLSHIWMCDGYLEHAKNRKKGTVQNIGWLCLEAYPKEELELLQQHLLSEFGIGSTLTPKPWGFKYRVRIGGENLQKLISVVYPHILPDFSHKTPLFYQNDTRVDWSLPNAEQYITKYTCIEDIVRHPTKVGRT